ncbi:hypothetical protein [Actinomadura oligospora]|uniref:hypothetical protein n=1 Tax=Actinomadura oligospora TaxID=111804 RepID=UPI00047DBC5E|nr:hypothetical protein [Actinomadura oligospora]
MSTAVMVVVAVVVVALVAVVVAAAARQARTRRLRRRFGPEYDRAVERQGGRAAAEHELMDRERRHGELSLRDLDPGQRELYRGQWTQVQERFVDAPEAALDQADRLVTVVMDKRGYPARDFEDRAAHLSVEHGRALDHYRRGRDIRLRATREKTSTEDLRQAMVHYRALFEDLVPEHAGDRAGERAGHEAAPGAAAEQRGGGPAPRS